MPRRRRKRKFWFVFWNLCITNEPILQFYHSTEGLVHLSKALSRTKQKLSSSGSFSFLSWQMNSLLTESCDSAYLDPTSKPPMTRNSVSLIFTVQLLRNVELLRGWGPSRHRLESSRKNWLLQVRYGHQSIFRLLLLRFFGSNLNKRPKVRSALIKVKKQEESINIFTYKNSKLV